MMRYSLLIVIALAFLSCLKKDIKKPCLTPYIDFVAYNVDPATLKVNFRGITSYNGAIRSYLWDFGDGTTFRGETPPEHAYPALTNTQSTKTYRVKYTVENECGQSYWTDDVKIGPCLPTVKFISTGVNDSLIQFTNQSTSNSTVIYTWNFGDGTTLVSNNTSVNKSYTTSGTFTVSLRASNACGDNFFTSTITICKRPRPAMTVTKTANNVSFNAGSSFNATSYQLSFGNSVNSPLQSSPLFTYTYPAQGNYTAILTVTNSCGSATLSIPISISCLGVGTLTMPSTSADDLTVTYLTTVSAPNASSYLWDFADGSTATGSVVSPKIFPNPGLYNVVITAANSCSSSTISLPTTVPYTALSVNPPSTSFIGVVSTSPTSIHYLSNTGAYYQYNGSNAWTTLPSSPIAVNANTKFVKDRFNNVYVYGLGGVARWTGTNWSFAQSNVLGYTSGATITAMEIDINGNQWTAASGQLRRNGTLVASPGTITSIVYSPILSRILFTLSGSTSIWNCNPTTFALTGLPIPNMSTNSKELVYSSYNGMMYFSSNQGIIALTSSGAYSNYFNASNTTGLSTAPSRIYPDNQGRIWTLLSINGDLIRFSPIVGNTDAKKYNVIPQINSIADLTIVNVSGSNNDLFLAKSQANAAVRIY
jgi:PKD repeat protein